MALAKDHMPGELTPNTLLLSNSFYEDHGSAGSSTQVSDLSSQGSYAYDEYKNTPPLDEEDINNIQVKYKPDSIGMNPKPGFCYDNRAQDVQSLINFKGGADQFMQGSGSLLSFEQSQAISNKNEAFTWKNNGTMSYDNQLLKQTSGLDSHLYEEISCGFGSIITAPKANMNHGETGCGWLYSDSTAVSDTFQEKGTQEPPGFHKRTYPGESTQAIKKQCASTSRSNSPKAKNVSSSKDPQSIAAKNRRERISERLKILQELVPNGTKVDLVTMLEKAISYVKFLQLQVKVLATDEFWPAQGGKAPDIAQVKEAIDVILSSQRDRNSSSSSK